MTVFLDFEASSLGILGYPIEIAWVAEDDTASSYLLRLEPSWTDWDDKSEAIHHISRAELARDGDDAANVARIAYAALSGCHVYSDSVYDRMWLDTLRDVAKLPSVAVKHVHELYGAAFQPLLKRLWVRWLKASSGRPRLSPRGSTRAGIGRRRTRHGCGRHTC